MFMITGEDKHGKFMEVTLLTAGEEKETVTLGISIDDKGEGCAKLCLGLFCGAL